MEGKLLYLLLSAILARRPSWEQRRSRAWVFWLILLLRDWCLATCASSAPHIPPIPTRCFARNLTAGRRRGAARGWRRCNSRQRTMFWTWAAVLDGFRGGWQNWCPKAAWWGWTFRTK